MNFASMDETLDKIGEENLQRATSGADSSVMRLSSIENKKNR
jgi:hypothetical protein